MTALDMITTRAAGGRFGDDVIRLDLAAELAARGIDAEEIDRNFEEAVEDLANVDFSDVLSLSLSLSLSPLCVCVCVCVCV